MPAVRVDDRIVVMDKKLFRDDNTRIFVGIVEEYDEAVIRTRGYAYHVNPYEITGTERAGDEQVRVISVHSDSMLYLLPREVDVGRVMLRRSPKSLVLTDGTLTLDLSEWLLRA